MSIKYHISPHSGEPKICKAEICPFGQDNPHFNNTKDAQNHFENIMKPLPKRTPDEEKTHRSLFLDQLDTIIAINESGQEIKINGIILENIDKTAELEISEGNSKEISEFLPLFTEGESEYEDGLDELLITSIKPMGDQLKIKEHYANTFTRDNVTYVLDAAFSEIDPNAIYPYVDTIENWQKEINRISFIGRDEYIPPPPDPRTFALPKVAPGSFNPLIEKAQLTESKKQTNGTFISFLKVNEVKVAAVRYKLDENNNPTLNSIETRSEYRHQGYMKKMLAELAVRYNVDKVYSSSSFTSNGYNYTRHLTKTKDGEKAEITHPRFTEEEPFEFISDWVEGNPL